MKIVLAQLNYHIANFSDNLSRIRIEVNKAEKGHADMILFSELAICGYPPQDLLEHRSFIEECETALNQVARMSNQTAILIGCPVVNPVKEGKLLYNSACFLYQGEVKEVFHKSLLPTYDIFDEYRYFESNTNFRLLEFKGKKIAVTICEDLWYDQPSENIFSRNRLYKVNPMDELARLDPDFIVNLAASPFAHLKSEIKKEIFTGNAIKYGLPVIYLNQVGAQTELIFEGGSMVVDRKGKIVQQLALFREDSMEVEIEDLLADNLPALSIGKNDRIGQIYEALVLGLKDYFRKMGFSRATLGLSGGIDSAVTLAIAAGALGAENLHVLLMPSKYSSDHSVNDAVKLAENLSVSYDIMPIQALFEKYNDSLKPVFKELREDTTEENIQSRIRGNLLMAYSNKFGHILLNTSNKSEAAVGYGTLYGDMAGGISVLGDVYKTDVYRLASYINKEKEIIPVNIITKPPSAELRPDQQDTDSLPEYDVLDKILMAYIEQQKPVQDIIADGNDRETTQRVLKLVNQNEYKRYQTPPILRISSKAFGVGRRMPLVAKY